MIINCMHTELSLLSLFFCPLNIWFTIGRHRLHAGTSVVFDMRFSHGWPYTWNFEVSIKLKKQSERK